MKLKTLSIFISIGIILCACIIIIILYSNNKKAENQKEAEIKTIVVDDIEIAYQEYGQGYPLIMIMGYSGTMDMWSIELIEKLSSQYRVIIFDNRGMGRSTASDKEFSIDLFTEDTAELMKALDIDQANILGWSMGTYMAQNLSLKYPGKINKLILYGADCGGDEAILPDEDTLAKLTNTSGSQEEQDEILLSLLFPAEWLEANPDPSQYFPEITEQSSPANIDRQTQAWLNWPGICNQIDQIQNDTLVITGTDDILTPPENSRIILNKIPNASLLEINNAGHGLMYQYPDQLAEYLLVFL
ncbi:alpha/beta hydrolase [Patescibacteria group bacterium]|nr:alpha/beta hydrolase [Patescibacteria group bacterium]